LEGYLHLHRKNKAI